MAVDIAAGLNSPESSVRIGAVRYIRRNMQAAEEACRNTGFDIVDKLLQMCDEFSDSSEKWEYVFTTLGFNDERTAELAKKVFTSERDSKFIVMAARRLSFFTDIEKFTFIKPILFADNNRNRTRLCANLLAGNSAIDAVTALRISAIADRKCDIPPFTADTADDWLSEMQGAYPESIRSRFLKLKERPYDLFLSRWDKLSVSLKKWALNTFLKDSPSGYEILIQSILSGNETADILTGALSCLKNLRDTSIFQEAVEKLLSHDDERVRAAAVVYSGNTAHLLELLETEKAQGVRANIIVRLSVSKEYIPVIAKHFSDPGWKVRAAAANAMVRLTPDSVDTVKELFINGNTDARTAAAKCLADLGMYEWAESCFSQ